MKKILKLILNILYYLFLTLEIAILAFVITSKITGANKSIFGYSIYMIATPSMEGVIDVGDCILSKEIKDVSTIQVHDIVTYKGIEGSYSDKLITHEVIAINETTNGYEFTFKGINNDIADPIVYEDQIVSLYICKLRIVTLFYKAISNIFGFIMIVILPITFIIISEIFSIRKEGLKDKEKIKNSNSQKEENIKNV